MKLVSLSTPDLDPLWYEVHPSRFPLQFIAEIRMSNGYQRFGPFPYSFPFTVYHAKLGYNVRGIAAGHGDYIPNLQGEDDP